jgi:hypothetical protein
MKIAIDDGTGRNFRGGVAAVAALCLLVSLALNWINAEATDTANLRPRELSDISRYLKTAYRNISAMRSRKVSARQAELNMIALRLNQRPRKTLGFRCPADKLSESVALTT